MSCGIVHDLVSDLCRAGLVRDVVSDPFCAGFVRDLVPDLCRAGLCMTWFRIYVEQVCA